VRRRETLRAALFAVVASSALPLGAWIAFGRPPSRAVTAALLAFASGALITAVAFELFEDAFRQDAWRAGVAFAAGASVFIAVDTWLDRHPERRSAAGRDSRLRLARRRDARRGP
jgi:zinc transporter, ZIP family